MKLKQIFIYLEIGIAINQSYRKKKYDVRINEAVTNWFCSKKKKIQLNAWHKQTEKSIGAVTNVFHSMRTNKRLKMKFMHIFILADVKIYLFIFFR